MHERQRGSGLLLVYDTAGILLPITTLWKMPDDPEADVSHPAKKPMRPSSEPTPGSDPGSTELKTPPPELRPLPGRPLAQIRVGQTVIAIASVSFSSTMTVGVISAKDGCSICCAKRKAALTFPPVI